MEQSTLNVKAFVAAVQHGYYQLVIDSLVNLGRLHLGYRMWREAAACADAAIFWTDKYRSPNKLSEALRFWSIAHSIDTPRNAIGAIVEAERLEGQSPLMAALSRVALCRWYLRAGDMKTTELLIKPALVVLREHSFANPLAGALCVYARCLESCGNHWLASETVTEALEIYERGGYPHYLVNAYKCAADILCEPRFHARLAEAQSEMVAGASAIRDKAAYDIVLTLDSEAQKPKNVLSAREGLIAELAGQRKSNAAIARHLGTSKATIRNQLQSVYRKLRINSRWQLPSTLYGNSLSAQLATPHSTLSYLEL